MCCFQFLLLPHFLFTQISKPRDLNLIGSKVDEKTHQWNSFGHDCSWEGSEMLAKWIEIQV